MTPRPVVPHGFSWIRGATVAHVAEWTRRGGVDGVTGGWESICWRRVFATYSTADGVRQVAYSREELPALPWCALCVRRVRSQAAGWVEGGLLGDLSCDPRLAEWREWSGAAYHLCGTND